MNMENSGLLICARVQIAMHVQTQAKYDSLLEVYLYFGCLKTLILNFFFFFNLLLVNLLFFPYRMFITVTKYCIKITNCADEVTVSSYFLVVTKSYDPF